MRQHISRSRDVTGLVVVPTQRFGENAERQGMIDNDEAWVSAETLQAVRGHQFTRWRYLDTLDRPPTMGSSVGTMEAWLARDESPFPPLDPGVVVQLQAMVMFVSP